MSSDKLTYNVSICYTLGIPFPAILYTTNLEWQDHLVHVGYVL